MAKALRNDITGLRAIAVLAVTFYHVAHMLYPQFDWIKGGFLGVDVFFVISGYLMTMIIVRGVDKGNFNLYDFYVKRAKRICPALLASVLMCLVLGVLLIGTSDLVRLAFAAGYALLMASNVYFAFNMDYFANAALDQPLLHTWSLGVEWQFYMVFPLIILLLRRFLDASLLPRSILILTILSFFCSIYGQELYPKHAYYMLPTRGGELLVGALAYFYPLSWFKQKIMNESKILRENQTESAGKFKKEDISNLDSQGEAQQGVVSHNDLLRNFARLLCIKGKPWQGELLGLIMIAISIVIVDSEHGWPTWHMVLPLFGAYLCVAANNERTLLGGIVFQKLGLWSYAIYLVHWPILVFVTKLGLAWSLSLDEVGASLTGKSLVGWFFLIVILVVMVLLAAVLHYGLERRRDFGYPTLILYILGIVACFYVANTGAPWRLQHNVSTYSQYGGHGVPFDGTVNEIGDLSRPVDFIFVGDSFARHYALDLIDRRLHVVTVFTDGCYSFGKFVSRRPEGIVATECRIRYASMQEALAKFPDVPVLFAQDWPRYVGTLVPQTNYQNIENQPASNSQEFTSSLLKDIQEKVLGKILFKDQLAVHKKAVAEDLAQLALDTQKRKVFILGTPKQTVYDIGSTCMHLQAMNNPLSYLLRQSITCTQSHKLREVPFNIWLEQTVAQYPHFIYLDPNDALCTDGVCEVMVNKDIPVYQDGLHYSWAGSIKVVSYILFRMGVEQGQVRTEFDF